jgi:hypothetical protein
MSKQVAAVGISYLSGGEWLTAAAGDSIEMDDEQVKDALAQGAIKPAAKTPPKAKEASK